MLLAPPWKSVRNEMNVFDGPYGESYTAVCYDPLFPDQLTRCAVAWAGMRAVFGMGWLYLSSVCVAGLPLALKPGC